MSRPLHVAMVLDADAVGTEGPMINRLAVGLVADGRRVSFVLDPETAPLLPPMAGVDRLEVPLRVAPWRSETRRRLLAALTERRPPDVVLARGRGAWTVARHLAELHGRPLAVDSWDLESLAAIARLARREPDLTALAPTRSLAERLSSRIDPDRVRYVPVGVPIPAEPAAVMAESERCIAVAVLGPARDVAVWRSVAAALVEATARVPQAHVFLECVGPAAHAAWREMRRAHLLERLSCLDEAAGVRPLLTRCDLLVVPEPPARVRSLILEAAGRGVPVIAAPSPCLDMFEDGRSGDLVPEADSGVWTERLLARLEAPEAARVLGLGGRERIARDHGSAVRVAAMGLALEELVQRAEARRGPDGEPGPRGPRSRLPRGPGGGGIFAAFRQRP